MPAWQFVAAAFTGWQLQQTEQGAAEMRVVQVLK
jgi:hypothetical protein